MALTRQERQARYRERRRLRLAAPSAVALAMSGVPSEQLDGFHQAVRERVQSYLADLGGAEGLAETKVMQVRSLVEAELVLEPMSRDVQALTQTGQLWSLRSRRAAALLADWLRLKEHRDRLLVAVGLERVAGASEQARLLADLDRRLEATRRLPEQSRPETGEGAAAQPGVVWQGGRPGDGQAGDEQPEGQIQATAESEPQAEVAEVAEAAASKAAALVLGTWSVVPEPARAEADIAF